MLVANLVSDALTILVKYGSSRSTNSQTTNVGPTSSELNLASDDITIRCICTGEHGWHIDSDDDARPVSSGGENLVINFFCTI